MIPLQFIYWKPRINQFKKKTVLQNPMTRCMNGGMFAHEKIDMSERREYINLISDHNESVISSLEGNWSKNLKDENKIEYSVRKYVVDDVLKLCFPFFSLLIHYTRTKCRTKYYNLFLLDSMTPIWSLWNDSCPVKYNINYILMWTNVFTQNTKITIEEHDVISILTRAILIT